jgi:hypothetical protein
MTPQPYQNAYDTALLELAEIAATFEQLRARKVMLEAAVHALEPFFASTEGATQASVESEAEHQPVGDESVIAVEQTAEEFSFRDVPSPLPELAETGGDPFQRRVKTSFRFKGFAAQRS